MLKEIKHHLSILAEYKLAILITIVVWEIVFFLGGHIEGMLALLPMIMIILYAWIMHARRTDHGTRKTLFYDASTMLIVGVLAGIVEVMLVTITIFVKNYSIMDIYYAGVMLLAYLPVFLMLIGLILFLQMFSGYRFCLILLGVIILVLGFDYSVAHILIRWVSRFTYMELLLNTNNVLLMYLTSILVLGSVYGIRYVRMNRV